MHNIMHMNLVVSMGLFVFMLEQRSAIDEILYWIKIITVVCTLSQALWPSFRGSI